MLCFYLVLAYLTCHGFFDSTTILFFQGIFFCHPPPVPYLIFYGIFVCISYCNQYFTYLKRPYLFPNHIFDAMLNIVISFLRYCNFYRLNNILFYLMILSSLLFYFILLQAPQGSANKSSRSI